MCIRDRGYTVKYGPRVEHMAVRHKDAQRNIRVDRLDPRFSETALREDVYKRQAHGIALASGQAHGDAALDGAVYDLYAAEDITHRCV